MLKTAKTFTVWSDELEGIFSPLFFISRPKKQKGFIALSKLATINPTRQKPKFSDDELVPYVGLPETGDREIQEVVMRPYKEVQGRNIIRKGDILFARIEPSVFNKKYIFVDDLRGHDFAFTSTEFYIVESNKDTNPIFLFNMFFVKPVYEQIIGKTTGSTGRRRLDKGVFEKIFIPLPTTELQNKIVTFLQEAYEQKKKKEAEILKILSSIDDFVLGELGIDMPRGGAERVFQIWSDEIEGRIDSFFYIPFFKTLQKAVENKNFAELGELVEFAKETWDQKSIFDDQFPYIEISNIDTAIGEIAKTDFVSVAEAPSRAKMVVRNGDIIVSTTRPNRGAITPITKEQDGFIASTGFAILRDMKNKKVLKDYLFVALRTSLSLRQMEQRMTGGNYPAITAEDLRKIKIVIPEMKTQEKIISGVKTIYEKAKRLRQEAESIVAGAQKQVEQMILSE